MYAGKSTRTCRLSSSLSRSYGKSVLIPAKALSSGASTVMLALLSISARRPACWARAENVSTPRNGRVRDVSRQCEDHDYHALAPSAAYLAVGWRD